MRSTEAAVDEEAMLSDPDSAVQEVFDLGNENNCHSRAGVINTQVGADTSSATGTYTLIDTKGSGTPAVRPSWNGGAGKLRPIYEDSQHPLAESFNSASFNGDIKIEKQKSKSRIESTEISQY